MTNMNKILESHYYGSIDSIDPDQEYERNREVCNKNRSHTEHEKHLSTCIKGSILLRS